MASKEVDEIFRKSRDERIYKLIARHGILSEILERFDFSEGATKRGSVRNRNVVKELIKEIESDLASFGVKES